MIQRDNTDSSEYEWIDRIFDDDYFDWREAKRQIVYHIETRYIHRREVERLLREARIDENMRMRRSITGDGVHNGNPMDFTYDRIAQLSQPTEVQESNNERD